MQTISKYCKATLIRSPSKKKFPMIQNFSFLNQHQFLVNRVCLEKKTRCPLPPRLFSSFSLQLMVELADQEWNCPRQI